MLVAQSCLTLRNPMDQSPPGSSGHRILWARILEWVAIPFSRGSYRPRNRIQVFCIFWCVLNCLSHQRSPLDPSGAKRKGWGVTWRIMASVSPLPSCPVNHCSYFIHRTLPTPGQLVSSKLPSSAILPLQTSASHKNSYRRDPHTARLSPSGSLHCATAHSP